MRLFYLMFLLALLSCHKVICKDTHDKSVCGDAAVEWAGVPEADGLGWVLRFPDGKMEVPSNLDDSYKSHSLQVAVCYEKTDDKFPCFCAGGFIKMVKITSIRKR